MQKKRLNVVLTRPKEKAELWIPELEKKGFQVQSLPLVELQAIQPNPLELLWGKLESYDAIAFTSGTAVEVFMDSIPDSVLVLAKKMPVFLTGESSQDLAKDFGLNVQSKPSKRVQNASGVAKDIANYFKNKKAKILFPCSALANTDLEDKLKSKDIAIDRVEIYLPSSPLHVDIELWKKLASGKGRTVIVFASPSAVENYVQGPFKNCLQNVKANLEYLAIGSTTAELLKQYWFSPLWVSDTPSLSGIIKLLESIK